MADLHTLSDLRIVLAETRAELREAEIRFAFAKAIAEASAIDDAYELLRLRGEGKPIDRSKALGANADERERALILALEDDAEYRKALRTKLDLQKRVELLQAAVDNAEDEQRERHRLTRQEFIDAMERWNVDRLADVVLDLTSAKARVDRAM